ncbi:hypothetical protein GCM10023195_47140 [Actinoallomurus liliacearum]|uniref:Uncharacterized protein n=1 Tax=Actinoallomurus liliacearum TaxID=1080073 RepID=A0ABP8TLI9_9ACTN
MLVCPHDGGVDADGPIQPADRIVVDLQMGQDRIEGAVTGPPAIPLIDGFPVPIPLGQVPPRRAGGQLPQHPVQHGAVIQPPPAAGRLGRQQRLDPLPGRIG